MDKFSFKGFIAEGDLAWLVCGAAIALLALGEFPLALGASGLAALAELSLKQIA